MQFQFYFALLPILTALVWAILLFTKRGAKTIHRFLAWMHVVFIATFVVLVSFLDPRSSWLNDVAFNVVTLTMPVLLVLLVYKTTSTDGIRESDYLLFLAPGLFIFFTTGIFLMMSPEEANAFSAAVNAPSPDPIDKPDLLWRAQLFFDYYFYYVLFLAEVLYALIKAIIRLKKYAKLLSRYFERYLDKGIRYATLLGLGNELIIACMLLIILTPKEVTFSPVLFGCVSVVGAFAIYLISWCGYKIDFTAEELNVIRKKADAMARELGYPDEETFTTAFHDETGLYFADWLAEHNKGGLLPEKQPISRHKKS